MIHFELIFVYDVRGWSNFFCTCISKFSSIICWKDNPFSSQLPLFLCQFLSGFNFSLLVYRKTVEFYIMNLYASNSLSSGSSKHFTWLHKIFVIGKSCCLWIKSILLSNLYTFYFFSLLYPPVKCWLEMVRADILALLLTSGYKQSVFHQEVWC